MKITENLLKLSGVSYGTNSNVYGVVYGNKVALIDCGYGELQWSQMKNNLEQWGYTLNDISHVFLTHGHFDHCLNAKRVNDIGAKLLCSENDKKLIEEGNPESETLFNTKSVLAKVDETIKGGEVFDLDSSTRITVLKTPGHSAGSLSYLIEVDGIKALAIGDMYWTIPTPPVDDVAIELGFMGSSDFSMKDYRESLKKIADTEFDILLPGHYYIYRGPRLKQLTNEAYKKAMSMED